jgi:uncharacterized protein YggT (Ycf19 family)
MKKILKIIFWILIILIIFAIVPESFWNKIKPYFNIEKLVQTIKAGFRNLIQFLQDVTGIDFSTLPEKIKEVLGIDLIKIWSAIKNFLATIFEKLARIFR